MKKIQTLLLIILLVVPIIVFAETCDSNSVKIESLEIKARNGNASEAEETTKSGTTINTNLNMMEVGDSIVYEAVLKNYSDEDYYLDENYLIVDTDYMEYSITSEDESNIIEANSSKSFDIKLRYRQQVQDSAFTSGKYTDDNNLVIGLATKSNNPFTSDYIALYLSIFYLSVFGLMYLFVKRKKIEETVIVLLVAMLVPLSVKALCQTQITINSKVNVEKLELATFSIECSNATYQYYKGMTFGEWVRSSLYDENIDGEYDTLEECERIFGSNRGCAYVRTDHLYTYKEYSHYFHTNENECNPEYTCEKYENSMYKGTYAYFISDTLEQCLEYYNQYSCQHINDKYMVLDAQYFYSEEDCNNRLQQLNYQYSVCNLIPEIYVEERVRYRRFSTEEQCENNKQPGDVCYQDEVDVYSPTIKSLSNGGKFIFRKDNITFNGSGSITINYDRVIDNSEPYHCDYIQ